jgi:hypothetical protein
MAITENMYYGTLSEANAYFENRLHEDAWFGSNPTERPKALLRATQTIDALNYKGNKQTVWELLEANPDATDAEIREAEAEQSLGFPRGADTTVPQVIRIACYECAYALLDGVDPDAELEQLAVVSQGVASLRTTYNRSQQPIEHLVHGIPSATAWRYIKPFLRDGYQVKLSRVS